MDKSYKSIWMAAVKSGMRQTLPEFVGVAVSKQHTDRAVFAGSLLYVQVVRPGTMLWLTWSPGPGVERYFNVLVGWSPALEHLPCMREHDRRLYSLRGPSPEFVAASLDLEQIEGKSGIGGIVIPSPWDQLLAVKATAPKKQMDVAMRKACIEADGLTPDERATAVNATVAQTLQRIARVLPRFRADLEPARNG